MIDLGDEVELTYPNMPATPATVTVTIGLPDQTTAGPFSAISGSYTYTTTQAGRHTVLWVSTGPSDAYSDVFDVASPSSQFLISLADAKAQLRVSNTANDEELRLYLAAITAVVERRTGPILQATHTQVTEAKDTIVLQRAPVVSVTSIVPTFPNAPSVYPAPTYLLDPIPGILRRQPFFFSQWGFDWGYNETYLPFYGRLTVTYVAGRSTVPEAVQVAARIILQDAWGSRRLADTPLRANADPEQLVDRVFIPEDAAALLETVSRGPRIV
jgi:hypothetical protein